MKKRFVHICEEFEYTWIGKDNGMIPIYAHEVLGYDSEIVTCDFKNDLPKEIRGVTITKVSRWFKNIKNFMPGVIFIKRVPLYNWIKKNAKDIDVLMLFHITKCSYWNAYFYKKFNPKGKLYIKADFNLDVYKKEIEKTTMKPKNLKEFFRKRREIKEYLKRKKLVEMADLISYETEIAYNYMKDSYAGVKTKGKTILLPNGYDSRYIDENFKVKDFQEKENIFLTVGRLGTYEKNTELILEALSEVDLKDWKFYLVGPVEKEFQKKIDEFYKNNPEKKDSVIFTGIIKNKKELYEYYNRAKVFVLPSRWESFGIVLVEALAFNSYILTTNTFAANDVTDNQKCGDIFEGSLELKDKIISIVNKSINLELKEKNIIDSKKKFSYEKIINKLKRLGI